MSQSIIDPQKDEFQPEAYKYLQEKKILHEMNTNIAVLAEQYKVQGGKIECIEIDIRDLKNKNPK